MTDLLAELHTAVSKLPPPDRSGKGRSDYGGINFPKSSASGRRRFAIAIVALLGAFVNEAQGEGVPNFSRPTKPASSPVVVFSEPQLFIDDYLIAKSSNIVRKTHAPTRALNHPILGWQAGTTQPYVTVIRDPRSTRFRMWYNKNLGPASSIAYAESADGIQWNMPSLGILGDNNELIRTGTVRTGYGISVVDDGPDARQPDERFKMAWWGQEKPPPRGDAGIRVAFSADGLHWTPYVGNPVLPDYSIDVDINDPRRPYGAGDIIDVFRDPYRNRYVALVKTPAVAADDFLAGPRAGKYVRRLVCQSISSDFEKWERPWRIAVPEARDAGLLEFYGVGGTIARGGLLIGFVRMLHDDYAATEGGPTEGIGYATLITSRDGKHWQRHDDVFFDRDPSPDAWDHAMAWIGCVVPVGDEYFVYYGGYKQGHKIEPLKERQIGLARMPRDRFVSRDAEDGLNGSLKTVALRLPGDASWLTINANSSNGEIRARVSDASGGQALPDYDWVDCRPVIGNGLELPVEWRSVNKLPSGGDDAPVQLEFQLKNAALYGFRIVTEQRDE
jgi:hypothetical protein